MRPTALGPRGWAAAVVAGAATVAAALFFVDPTQGAWFLPPCPFLATTGWQCPGCGSTRAVHELLHGNLREALALNPLLVVYLPVLGWALLDQLVILARGRGLERRGIPALWIYGLLALICGFWVARNF